MIINTVKKVVILGSGPGGLEAALRLAKAGLEVIVIEKDKLGGTCLNVGCIPTKTLLDYSSSFEFFKETIAKNKIFEGNVSINPEALRNYQQEVIKQLSFGIEKSFQKSKVKVVNGKATFISEDKIEVINEKGTTVIEADYFVIATGSKPRAIPSFQFDGKLIVSSDDLWNIPRIPQSLLVVGSGPIGIEFARVFHNLGTKVTISEIKEKICPILDNEISENLVRSLKKRGIVLKPNTATKFLEKKDTVKVEFISTVESKKENGEYEQVLIATGREPNTAELSLDKAGVELEPVGFIRVNEYLGTTNKKIWAIGDVTNYPQLAHTATYQAKAAVRNISGGKVSFNGEFIPSCIFGYPEIAFAGETEEVLKEKGISYKIGKALFLSSGKAKASGHTEGLVKILIDARTDKILGVHIIGPEASVLIHELVVAMQNNLTAHQVSESIHAHPTYSEAISEALESSLKEAVTAQ